MHVLIVDDELLARNRLHVLLSECEDPAAPFKVQEADCVAQAQEVLQHSGNQLTSYFSIYKCPAPQAWCLRKPCMP